MSRDTRVAEVRALAESIAERADVPTDARDAAAAIVALTRPRHHARLRESTLAVLRMVAHRIDRADMPSAIDQTKQSVAGKLQLLRERGLIVRAADGSYRVTTDGRAALEAQEGGHYEEEIES